MPVGYDKKSMQHDQMLLSLPLIEVPTGEIYDLTKPHHYVLGNVSWAQLASGLPVLSLDGAAEYADILAADSADLDITTEDYSVAGWVYYQSTSLTQLLIGRYGVDLDGWEIYLYEANQTLSLRHHHPSIGPPDRSGCYSEGWALNNWYLFGISRDSAYPRMYRNGEEVEVTYDAGGLSDPDTCNRDLVIGVRYTKNANWFEGYMYGLRVWVGKALTAEEHRHIFNTERRWFGV